MKMLRKLTSLAASTILSLATFTSYPIQAQNNNLGDLPNDRQQMKSWKCERADKAIEVEAKNVAIWKETIEEEGWKCQEKVSDTTSKTLQFSCEPNDTIGILTVVWLQGEDANEQMETWIKKLGDRQGISCQMAQTEPWDNNNDIPPPRPTAP
jgi:hypothetical protein